MAKVDNLLATLRGESVPEPEPEAPPPLEGPAGGGTVSEGALDPLRQRIEELERRLEEVAVQAAEPPPLEAPPMEEAEEPLPPEPPPPDPPQAPTEITLFLQTKMELLEKKLELAQQESVRANLLLREREQAQRMARTEVEDLFRNIREQQRAASYDQVVRRQLSASQIRVRELETRLAMAELRMIPADEVARHLETEEGRGELARRIREQLTKAAAGPELSPPQSGGEEPPMAPSPAQIAAAQSGRPRLPETAPPAAGSPVHPSGPAREAVEGGTVPSDLAVVLGRVADLEARLEETRKERDREREARQHWEEDLLAALQQTRRQWQKGGGPELLVEAALETMVSSLRERDILHKKLSKTVRALQDEAPDSRERPLLQAELAEQQKRLDALQEKLTKQMAVVQAWLERNKGNA